jgi:hypothetical protein
VIPVIATSVPLTARERFVLEAASIHQAACRYRRQGLICSICLDTGELAERVRSYTRTAAA